MSGIPLSRNRLPQGDRSNENVSRDGEDRMFLWLIEVAPVI